MIEGKLTEYGQSFQNKAISNLLTDPDFLRQSIEIISPSHFDNEHDKWVVSKIISYYEGYKTIPSLDYFKAELKKIKTEVQKLAIKEKIKDVYSISKSEDHKYIQKEYINFCKNQNLKTAINTSVDLLDAGNYEDIRVLINDALQAGTQQEGGHIYKDHLEERYSSKERITIPTPWEDINVLLGGGLGPGDLGMVAGNPGGGKSWVMVAIAAHAVKMGNNVLFCTLELDEDYVGKRFDAYFTNIPVNELNATSKPIIKDTIAKLSGSLEIKRFRAQKTTLSEVETYTERLINNGFKPDLIVIDYLDLLKVKNNKDKRNQLEDLYTEAREFGKDYNVPVWSPSQVNRTGARDEVIEGDQIAESYSKLMIADFAMSLSRTREDKINDTGRFHIMKNRYGADGYTYNADFDASTGIINIKGKHTQVSSGNPEIPRSGSTGRVIENLISGRNTY
jgi:replicative DNA helicase